MCWEYMKPRFERCKIIQYSIVPGILATHNTVSSKHHPVLTVQAKPGYKPIAMAMCKRLQYVLSRPARIHTEVITIHSPVQTAFFA